MSVIARAPDGTIRLYCKGSDTKVMAKLRGRDPATPPALHARTEENLSLFARQVRRQLVWVCVGGGWYGVVGWGGV